MTTNQQKLRELINKACPELVTDRQIPCPDNQIGCLVYHAEKVYIDPDLSHLLIALGKRGYEIVTGIDTHIMVIRIGKLVIPYNLTKPPLEQSEEVLTELINLLSSKNLTNN